MVIEIVYFLHVTPAGPVAPRCREFSAQCRATSLFVVIEKHLRIQDGHGISADSRFILQKQSESKIRIYVNPIEGARIFCVERFTVAAVVAGVQTDAAGSSPRRYSRMVAVISG